MTEKKDPMPDYDYENPDSGPLPLPEEDLPEEPIKREGRSVGIAEALIEVIKADPEDDLSYLAYADLLEERGETDRAEFVRIQLDLAQKLKTDDLDSFDYDKLDHFQDIVDTADKEKYPQITGIGYDRGFIKNVFVGSEKIDDFVKDLGKITKENPFLDALYFSSENQSTLSESKLLDSPLLERIKEIHLEKCSIDSLRLVLNCQHLSNVEVLSLWDSRIGDEGLELLLSYPVKVSKISKLNLRGTFISEEGVQLLINSPDLGNLKLLNLEANYEINPEMQQRLREHFREKVKIFF